MVNSCCVPLCHTGYKPRKGEKETESSENIALFRFPRDTSLQEKWLQAIPRENLRLSESLRVCAKHFYSEDISFSSQDSRNKRRNSRECDLLKSARLNPGAVPRIFPSLPRYLTKPPASESLRSTVSTSASARLQLENSRIEELNSSMMAEDHVSSFDELCEKLRDITLPVNFVPILKETTITFVYLPIESRKQPKVLASVSVDDNLKFAAHVLSAPIGHKRMHHILQHNQIQSLSELSNVLAYCKSLVDSDITQTEERDNLLLTGTSLLEKYAQENEEVENCDSKLISLIRFFIEQLKLCQLESNARRYSTTTISQSFFWQMTSTSLYRRLRDFFVLPSISRLRQLSRTTSVHLEDIDISFLKTRSSALSEREKIVTLLIDEVYTAQKVEYENGKFIGLTSDGQIAKTVLTFMVQSISSKHKDVVCMVPMINLTTKHLRAWFNKVMSALNEIFLVVAVSVDNHVVNR